MITITKSLDSSAITGEKRGSRMDGKEECKSNEGKCVGGKKCKNKDTITTIDCGGKKVCCVGKPYAIARFCSSEFSFPMTIFGIDETSLISSNVTLLTLSLSGIQQLIFCWLSWSFNSKKKGIQYRLNTQSSKLAQGTRGHLKLFKIYTFSAIL